MDGGAAGADGGGALVGAAAARAPGVCGELVQGLTGGVNFLVTCPVDFFSRVRVELYDGGPGVTAPAGCEKTAAAVRRALARLRRPRLRAVVQVHSPIPRSKGLGSSSADLAAAIAATALAAGQPLPPDEIAQIALSIEPTDGIMLPGIALFDHRAGQLRESLGPPPPMEIVALDLGGIVDTDEFNLVNRAWQWQAVSGQTDEALALVRRGIAQQDPALVGRGATISAQAAQNILPKPRLDEALDFAASVGAVGVNVGHSGTIIGLLLDARQRRGKSTYHRAAAAFPDAEAVYHFRMLGGGVRV